MYYIPQYSINKVYFILSYFKTISNLDLIKIIAKFKGSWEGWRLVISLILNYIFSLKTIENYQTSLPRLGFVGYANLNQDPASLHCCLYSLPEWSEKWIIRCCNIIVFLASTRNRNFSMGRTRLFSQNWLLHE